MKAQNYSASFKARWDALARSSPDGGMFHLRWFNDLLAACWPEQDCSVFVEAAGELVGILPLQHRHFDNKLWSAGRGFAGPALHAGLSKSERQSVLSALATGALNRAAEVGAVGVCSCPWTLSESFLAGDTPQLPGGAVSTVYPVRQVHLDKPWSDVESEFRKTTRQELRKAERAGLSVRELNAHEAGRVYYPMHLETYDRTGAKAHPRAYFDGIWQNCLGTGRCVVYCASRNSDDIAVLNVGLNENGTAWYWTGASTTQGLDCRAGHLLQAHAMRCLHGRGFRVYELGALVPETGDAKLKGLATFKTGFGGQDTEARVSFLKVARAAQIVGRARRGIRRLSGRSTA